MSLCACIWCTTSSINVQANHPIFWSSSPSPSYKTTVWAGKVPQKHIMVSWVWWLYPLKKKQGGPHACFDSNSRQVMVCWELYWHVLILLFRTLHSIQCCHSEPPVQLISDTLGKINPFIPSHHLQNGRELLRIQPRGLVDLMKALDVLGIHDVTWKHGSCHGSSHIISHQIIVANSPGTLKKWFHQEKSHKNKNAVQQDEGFPTSYQWYILEPPPTQYQSPFSRIVPFSEGNPNLNLHLWLESWVGGRPLRYINVSWFLPWLPKVHSLSDTSAHVALKKLKRELPGHVDETSAPSGLDGWMFHKKMCNWLVISTHLKNISQNGNLPQIGVKTKNIWNHHLGN